MKFATQYKFDDSKMLYALYSEGFRLGGKNSARAAMFGRGTGDLQAGHSWIITSSASSRSGSTTAYC